MATDLKPQTKTAPGLKYEHFVEQQLGQARRRIRNLDTLTAALTLLIGVLVYALGMSALDRALNLSVEVRTAAFLVCAAGAAFYAGLIVFRRVQWHVNPYYAARRLEQTIPDAKNSLINWLDLRDAPMPPVIRGTLGRKAAKDLTGADLEGALGSRRPAWLGGIAGALALALLVWFLMGPGQLASLLQRAFLPFEKVAIARRTEIVLVAPAGGDVTVPVKQDVQIRVEVRGRVPRVNQPDALKLHYRYRRSDPYIVRPLEEDADGQWFKTVTADDLLEGFYYKVTGGDAATPEYEIKVRALPAVRRFDVTYHYRPYLLQSDRTVHYGPSERLPRPDLKEPRGTEVTLVARTNCVWRSGRLVLQEGPAVKQLSGEPVADDPQAKAFKFVLDRSGSFQVHFTSAEGEANLDRGSYKIDVLEDRAPVVVLTRPGKDIQLPANGTLALDGAARDDHGVKAMTLRLRVKKGPQTPELAAKPYRPGVSFKLADGSYPTDLTYKDVVSLEKLKTAKGEAFPLAAGMVLEYWLEAVDNCDYPNAAGNVGASKHYDVTIVAADRDEKRQQQQRQQGEREKAEHEKQQDRTQKERNQQAEEEKQAAKLDPAEREKQEQKKREDFEKQADKVRQELERQEKEEKQKGGAKGDSRSESKGDKKDKGPEQGGAGAGDKKDDKNKPQEGQAAQKKDGGKDNKGPEKGGAKDGGDKGQQKQGEGQPQAGEGKGPDKSGAQAGSQGQAKDQKGPSKDQAPSQAKGQGEQPPGQQAGAEKGGGANQEQKAEAGKSKDDGKGGMGGGQQTADKKNGGAEGMQSAAKAKGDGKGDAGASPQQAQTAPKDGPKDQAAKGKGAGDAKGQPKASQAKGPGQQGTAGQKGQPGQEQRAEGSVKGQRPPETRGGPKGPGSQQNAAQKAGGAKGGDPQRQQGTAAAQKKSADPKQAQSAGQGKGERGADDARAQQSPNRQEATMEDIANLKERLEREGQRKEALDELGRTQKEVRDPKVREAAEKLLKQYGRDVLGSEPGGAKGADKTSEKMAKSGSKGQGTPDPAGKRPEAGKTKRQGPSEGKTAGKGKEGGDPGKGQQTADKGEAKKGGKRYGDGRTGEGSLGTEDTGPASAVDEAAARRAGELQLEKLRDRLRKNPELLKRLDWKEQDLDRFLRQARKYQQWLREQQTQGGTERETALGGKSLLPSVGPRTVGPRPNATRDPLELGGGQPPPEFRQAQRIFTGKTRE
jgi:hypothetical protein